MNPAIERWLTAYKAGLILPHNGRIFLAFDFVHGDAPITHMHGGFLPAWLVYLQVQVFNSLSAGYRPEWLAGFARRVPRFPDLSYRQWQDLEVMAGGLVLGRGLTQKENESLVRLEIVNQRRNPTVVTRMFLQGCRGAYDADSSGQRCRDYADQVGRDLLKEISIQLKE